VYSKKMPPLRQPSNPDFPQLTHSVTMAVTLGQLHMMVMDPYRWLAPITRAASAPRVPAMAYYSGGNMLESVLWMWHRCRTGIAVCIRGGQLQLCVPFCNPDYVNTWSPQARHMAPSIGLSPDCWWANGWTLCGDAVSSQLWGDQGVCAMQNMIMVACEKGIVSDCDFIINKRDSACVRLDHCDAMNPMDMHQCPIARPALVPVLSLYTGDQFADIAMPLPCDWHRLSRGTFQAQNPLPPCPLPKKAILWSGKQDAAIFRGSLTGAGAHAGTNQRIALLQMHDGHRLDLKGTSANRRLRFCPLERSVVMPSYGSLDVGKHHYMPLHEQQEKYRYAVTIDGHSGADRLASLAGGNQCILKVDPPHHALCPETWASQRMHAWEHYVPVRKDMSDLHECLQWARNQGGACTRIRRNCDDWSRDERQSILRWWVGISAAMSLCQGPVPS